MSRVHKNLRGDLAVLHAIRDEHGLGPMSVNEIALNVGCSHQYIHSVEQKALKKLRLKPSVRKLLQEVAS